MSQESSHEGYPTENRAPFPIKGAAIAKVDQEIQTRFGGDIGRFADTEMMEITKDPQLKDLMGMALERYTDEVGERWTEPNAFYEGAAYVHRMVRAQGNIPTLPENLSSVMKKEDEAYEQLAHRKNQTVGDLLSRLDQTAFERLPDLSPDGEGRELGAALRRQTAQHPSKPSFVYGAEIMYSALRGADQQARDFHVPDFDPDAELAKLTQQDEEQKGFDREFDAIVHQPVKPVDPDKD